MIRVFARLWVLGLAPGAALAQNAMAWSTLGK